METAAEAFKREFAPWSLRIPEADLADRRSGQLRANGWSVLYSFGRDALGEYLDYYAALRDGADERVHDDWHARLYDTGQCVAFPAVLEAFLYGRDPSDEELERARAPIIALLAGDTPPGDAPVAEEPAPLGSADTALWENIRDAVEAGAVQPAPEPPAEPAVGDIDDVLSRAFAALEDKPDVAAPAAPALTERPRAPQWHEPPSMRGPTPAAPLPAAPAPPAPVSEVPVVGQVRIAPPMMLTPAHGLDLYIPEGAAVPASVPMGEPRAASAPGRGRAADQKPLWRRYPRRALAIALGVAAVLVMAIVVAARHWGKPEVREARVPAPARAVAPVDTTPIDTTPPPDTGTDIVPTSAAADSVTPAVAPTPSAVIEKPTVLDSAVARPVGPGSIAPIVRTDGTDSHPTASHQFSHPTPPPAPER